jgi:hypothetical protein
MRSCIVITAAILLVTNFQAKGPKPYESKAGKFKVVFPGEPEVSTKKTEDNENLFMACYSPPGGGGFFVIYSDLKGDKLKNSKPKEILNSGKEGLIESVKAEIKKSTEIEFGRQKFPALRIEGEATFPGEKTKVNLNMTIILTHENRLYQVFVFGSKDLASSKDAEKFLNSFEIAK